MACRHGPMAAPTRPTPRTPTCTSRAVMSRATAPRTGTPPGPSSTASSTSCCGHVCERGVCVVWELGRRSQGGHWHNTAARRLGALAPALTLAKGCQHDHHKLKAEQAPALYLLLSFHTHPPARRWTSAPAGAAAGALRRWWAGVWAR